MPIAKRIGLAILSPLFVVLLFATAFDIGFTSTATNPSTVKQLVRESGLYNTFIPSVLKQTKTISILGGSFSTDDPALINAANQAVTPQYVQQNGEMVIDSVYRWLEGTTAAPDFEIKLTDIKAKFANNVAAAVQLHSVGLPYCKTPQEVAANIDPLIASCLPPGLSGEYIASITKQGLLDNQDFLKQSDFNAYDIYSGSKNTPIFQRNVIKDIPKQYQRAKNAPLILSLLTLLAGLGVVFLSQTWQKGLRHMGIGLVIVGVLMLVFSWALNRTVSTKITPKIKIENAILQQDIRNLARDLSQQIDKNYWWFGGIYTVLGTAAIFSGELLHRRAQTVPTDESKNRSAPETGSTPEPEPNRKT